MFKRFRVDADASSQKPENARNVNNAFGGGTGAEISFKVESEKAEVKGNFGDETAESSTERSKHIVRVELSP